MRGRTVVVCGVEVYKKGKWTKDAKPLKDIKMTYLFTLFSSITTISF
jgi:hypothetical protein